MLGGQLVTQELVHGSGSGGFRVAAKARVDLLVGGAEGDGSRHEQRELEFLRLAGELPELLLEEDDRSAL